MTTHGQAGPDIPRAPVIGAAVAAVALGVIMTFAYLGAFVDPEGNLTDLPVGVVDRDRPTTLPDGRRLAVGRAFVAELRRRDAQVRQIDWRTYRRAGDALGALDEARLAGVLIVPADLSAQVARNAVALSTGQEAAAPAPAPASAAVRFVHNRGLGLFPDNVARRAVRAAVGELSAETSRQLAAQLGRLGVTVAPADAATLASPVVLDDVERPPLGDHAGLGLTPLYTAIMLTLTGFVGLSVVHVVLSHLAGEISFEVLGRRVVLGHAAPTPLRLWATAALAAVGLAVAAGIAIPVVVVEVIGAQAGPLVGFLPFSMLAIAAIAFMCLTFLTLLGLLGEVPSLLVTTIFGVPSAGGVYPVEALPGFFVALAAVLPMRYITDGARSLFFYDGRAAAGLGRAYAVLAVWLVGSALAGALAAGWRTRRARQPHRSGT